MVPLYQPHNFSLKYPEILYTYMIIFSFFSYRILFNIFFPPSVFHRTKYLRKHATLGLTNFFSVKGHMVNILGFTGPSISAVITVQLGSAALV